MCMRRRRRSRSSPVSMTRFPCDGRRGRQEFALVRACFVLRASTRFAPQYTAAEKIIRRVRTPPHVITRIRRPANVCVATILSSLSVRSKNGVRWGTNGNGTAAGSGVANRKALPRQCATWFCRRPVVFKLSPFAPSDVDLHTIHAHVTDTKRHVEVLIAKTDHALHSSQFFRNYSFIKCLKTKHLYLKKSVLHSLSPSTKMSTFSISQQLMLLSIHFFNLKISILIKILNVFNWIQ